MSAPLTEEELDAVAGRLGVFRDSADGAVRMLAIDIERMLATLDARRTEIATLTAERDSVLVDLQSAHAEIDLIGVDHSAMRARAERAEHAVVREPKGGAS